MSQRKCEVLTQTFTFLVGVLQSPALRTLRAEPVQKNHPVVAIPAPVLQSLAFVQTLVSLTCAASFYCHWDVVKCWK